MDNGILSGRDAERNNLLDRIDALETRVRALQETAVSFGNAASLLSVAIDRSVAIGDMAANPTATASTANVYLNGSKLIIQYDDSGTTRYKYLELTGTGATWVHTTTAP